ncbi:MAG: NAD(P)H-hydrate dehydratase [Nitrospinota bacterium]
MKKIFNRVEALELDSRLTDHYQLPSILLMENAGSFTAKVILDEIQDDPHPKVNIFVGKGNNGGDALVAARYLMNSKINCSIFLVGAKESLPSLSRSHLETLEKSNGHIRIVDSEESLELYRRDLIHATVVVDGLFGVGLNRAITGFHGEVIAIMNRYGKLKVALDIPSGLTANSGEIIGTHFRADLTITFAGYKLCSSLYPAAASCGKTILTDIGAPIKSINEAKCQGYLIERSDASCRLPKRLAYHDKSQFGHPLLVAGSTGMEGAAIIASLAALRSGSGRVTVATTKSAATHMNSAHPELMTLALPETKFKQISSKGIELLLSKLHKYNVVLIGPGLGIAPDLLKLIKELLKGSTIPIVIDADGLNNIKDDLNILRESSSPILITPHSAEMSRLINVASNKIEENKISYAVEFANSYNVAIALKGATTVIAAPNNITWVNVQPTDLLATGGSGDTLAGMVTSFIGQGNSVVDAAIAATFYHSLTAKVYAKKNLASRGMIATDIIELLPTVLK